MSRGLTQYQTTTTTTTTTLKSKSNSVLADRQLRKTRAKEGLSSSSNNSSSTSTSRSHRYAKLLQSASRLLTALYRSLQLPGLSFGPRRRWAIYASCKLLQSKSTPITLAAKSIPRWPASSQRRARAASRPKRGGGSASFSAVSVAAAAAASRRTSRPHSRPASASVLLCPLKAAQAHR